MNLSMNCLALDQVQALLATELSPADMAAVEIHLSQCANCRSQLESAIGAPEWWQEARECLSEVTTRCPTAVDSHSDLEASESSHADVLRFLGPTDDPRMLGRIGNYEIVGILGRGGMGVVFKGFDSALNRYVAIKMLAPHLTASGAARKRFEREAQAAAAVVHDHVMAIHNVAEWLGAPYFVMPYVRGNTLQKRLDQRGVLELREILRIGMQLASGLAAAHAQGLVHRDIKPGNILLAEGVERVTLMDFGLARAVDDASLTRTGVLAGTPQYMSPEQARGQAIDFRSDLFSLGSVLYAMCTGRAPFRAETSYGVLRLITDQEPPSIRELNSEIPDWLNGIIERLMAKTPDQRFESARDVAELLETCLAHVQQPMLVSLPLGIRSAQNPWMQLARPRFIFATLAVLGLIPVGLVYAYRNSTQQPETPLQTKPTTNPGSLTVVIADSSATTTTSGDTGAIATNATGAVASDSHTFDSHPLDATIPVPHDWFRPDPYPQLGAVSALGFDRAYVELSARDFAASETAIPRQQREKLQSILSAANVRSRQISQLLNRADQNAETRAQIKGDLSQHWSQVRKQVDQCLEPQQRTRVAQLIWQRWGYHAFTSPDLHEKLDVLAPQASAIRAAIHQHGQRIKALELQLASQQLDLQHKEVNSSETITELQREKNQRGVESHRQCWADLYRILSVKQRIQYRELRGPAVAHLPAVNVVSKSTNPQLDPTTKSAIQYHLNLPQTGTWQGSTDNVDVTIQKLQESQLLWTICSPQNESLEEKLKCNTDQKLGRIQLSIESETGPEVVGYLEVLKNNELRLTIQGSKFTRYPLIQKLTLKPQQPD